MTVYFFEITALRDQLVHFCWLHMAFLLTIGQLYFTAHNLQDGGLEWYSANVILLLVKIQSSPSLFSMPVGLFSRPYSLSVMMWAPMCAAVFSASIL